MVWERRSVHKESLDRGWEILVGSCGGTPSGPSVGRDS